MNILHLTTFLQGGAGRIIASLAAGQHDAGHRVTVVTSRSGPTGYGNYDAYIEQLTRAGVAVHLVDSLFVREHAANLSVVRLIDRVVAPGEEPEIIHAHAAVPSLVGLLFAGSRSHPMPIVQTMHGWGVTKTADQAAADVAVLNLVHRVAVPSDHSRRSLVSLGVAPARLTVVPYGVHDGTCDGSARDRDLLNDMAAARRAGRTVLASIGTIGPRKNQRAIVAAIAATRDTLPVFCVFVGDGDTADLSTAIEVAGVGDRCRIHGYSAAARWIAAAADALVLPSRSEGQPVSVLEAFADGTIVAVSNIPELVELVDDGVTGVVFNVSDPASLALALVRIAAMTPGERDGMRARARQVFGSTFTAAAMGDRYQHLYREVIDERRAHATPVLRFPVRGARRR